MSIYTVKVPPMAVHCPLDTSQLFTQAQNRDSHWLVKKIHSIGKFVFRMPVCWKTIQRQTNSLTYTSSTVYCRASVNIDILCPAGLHTTLTRFMQIFLTICLLSDFEFNRIVCNQVPLGIVNCTYYSALSCTV